MPTDKEIEEAMDLETGFNDAWGRRVLRDAYLSMKTERDWWENHCKDWEASRNEMEAERDKYKAIVEADTNALKASEFYMRDHEYTHKLIDDALAMRENKEE